MGKKNSILIDIAKEINEYSRDIAKQMAIYTRDELMKEAQRAIKIFYNHYSPIYYYRHKPIGYNINKSFRKYYANDHNIVYKGGIELSSNWMNDIYRADKDYVFNLVFSGYHGNVTMLPFPIFHTPPIMSPSPLDIILIKRDKLRKDAQKNANKIAHSLHKSSYKYIK